VDIGNITGPIALAITLLWWFGITPKRIAKWAKDRKVRNYATLTLQILLVAWSIFEAVVNFAAASKDLGQNSWAYGGAWIAFSIVFTTLIAERYVKKGTVGKLLIIGKILFTVAAGTLIGITLEVSAKDAIFFVAIPLGATLIVFGTIFLITKLREVKNKSPG